MCCFQFLLILRNLTLLPYNWGPEFRETRQVAPRVRCGRTKRPKGVFKSTWISQSTWTNIAHFWNPTTRSLLSGSCERNQFPQIVVCISASLFWIGVPTYALNSNKCFIYVNLLLESISTLNGFVLLVHYSLFSSSRLCKT